MTPNVEIPLGFIPRPTIPSTFWSPKTTLIGLKVRPAIGRSDHRDPPGGQLKPNGGGPVGVGAATRRLRRASVRPICLDRIPTPLTVDVKPVAVGWPWAIKYGFGPSE